MKKYFFFAAALVALAACSKSPVAETADPDEVFTGSEMYPITFSSNVVATKAKVKGSGSVAAWNDSQTLYVYGIKRDEAADTLYWKDGIQIDNVAAAAPADGTEGAINVYDPAFPGENKPFYYDNSGRYDFFGYYVDDAFVDGQETPALNEGTITLPIAIDGTQDVMLAYADRNAAVEGTSYSASKMFSSYGVRKGIIPNLKFEHQLSRFIFQVKKGTVPAEGEPEPVVQPGVLYINSLSVDSYADAMMTIVGENRGLALPEGAELTYFPLTDRGTPFEQTLVEGTAKVLGESVMVMPGRVKYNLKFVLENEAGVQQETNNMSFDIVGGALAGKSYTITLTVYNLEQIELKVSLVAWDEETDPINIGEDED